MMKHGARGRIAVLAILLMTTGCGAFGMGEKAVVPGVPFDVANAVTIRYSLTSARGWASNQWAIWIENSDGAHVKTLFVPDFTARKQGWKKRPRMLVTWRKTIDLEHMPKETIDALSRATPRTGEYASVWDLTDAAGTPVPPGTYTYYIEGSLFWENTVLWMGTIDIGGAASSSVAEASYFPDGAEELGRTLISKVRAVYLPGM